MSHRWRWSWFGAKSDATVEVLAEAASLLALAASPFPGWAFSLSLSLASWLFSCSALGMQTTCAPPPFTASLHLEVHSDTQCPILKVNPVKPIVSYLISKASKLSTWSNCRFTQSTACFVVGKFILKSSGVFLLWNPYWF